VTADRSVLVDRVGRVAILRLNRPEVRNALSPGLVLALHSAVASADLDPGVGSILLAGEGRAFSSGGDLTAMRTMDREAFRAYISDIQDLARAFRSLTKPSIAAVHGPVLAGGFELAIACDVRIAADDARFGLPDTALGLSPTSGMTWILPRLVGEGWARHLLFTGETLDAAAAFRIGLVTRVVPITMLEDDALDLARAVAEHPPVGLARIRSGLREAQTGTFDAALEAELDAEVACFDTDAVHAGLRAFAERRRSPGNGG
jgi:enoyl-CoA hydratase/carnithine racemase